MLMIRKEQMQAFEKAAMASFDQEMAIHCRKFSPHICEQIGDAMLRNTVQGAISRCAAYGFTNRGPIRLFIEMAFLFGSAFDTDPQFTWSAAILRAPADQMVRAERLYAKVMDYQKKVPNPDMAATIRALENLSNWVGKNTFSSISKFISTMILEMNRLRPAAAVYAGEAGLTDLLLEGCAEAEKYGFPTIYGQALMGMLMFAFGHGFLDDPLHPWTKPSLKQAPPGDPTDRALALKTAACAFLERMAPVSPERNRS
jgi:hypothetical protein